MEAIIATGPGDASLANESDTLHPYFPMGTALPGYTANSLSTPALLASFAIGTFNIFFFTRMLALSSRPRLSEGEMLTTMWFSLCGFIHLFFEGESQRLSHLTSHTNSIPT